MIARVCDAVKNAGGILMKYFEALDADEIAVKEGGGIVTRADTEAEDYLMHELGRIVPGSGFLAEESGDSAPGNGRWIIDPLDGTSNFANGIPWFSVSVAFEPETGSGRMSLGVIYNPATEEMFFGDRETGGFFGDRAIGLSQKEDLARSLVATGFYYHKGEKLNRAMQAFARVQQQALGVRRFGSAALDLAYVAAGRFEGFWERGLSPWDVAAGTFLIELAGGRLTDFSGQPYSLYSDETVATNGIIHDRLLDLITGS